jgi:hypothetical protein
MAKSKIMVYKAFYYKVTCNCGWFNENQPTDIENAKESGQRHLKSCFLSNPKILINKYNGEDIINNDTGKAITITR